MPKDFLVNNRRVLIVSSHPLFAKGLTRLLQNREQADVDVLGVVASLEAAVASIERLNPDLVVVDYDDKAVNRDDLLSQFLVGGERMRVVLLSLQKGGDHAVVYDRRSMAASNINEWLEEWNAVSGTAEQLSGAESFNSRSSTMKNLLHGIGVTLVVAIFAAIGIFGLRNEWLLPIPAAVQAAPIDQLFSYHWILISALFALIFGIMVYSFIFFRRKPGDETDGPHIEGNNALEVTWTILPLITVLGFAVIGSQTLREVLLPDPDAMEVRVIGQQWAWRFEYPEFGVTSTELVLPINQQVLLRMESTDVLHSFWVPEFRIKQDLVPGQETQLRITPNKVGDYKVRCAEICGASHYAMLADVKVVGEREFINWTISKSELPEDPIARGQIYAEQYGCIACHSLDGTRIIGPTWQGAYLSEVPLENGSTVIADDTYLYESIVNPLAKIHAGYPANQMPLNFSETLREDQINDIIEFIKSLQ